MANERLKGEEPRSEPEIIPPGRARREARRVHIFVDVHGIEHEYVAKPVSLGAILATLITGLLSIVLAVLLLGTLLIWLPAVILLVTAAMVAGLLRMYFQRAP